MKSLSFIVSLFALLSVTACGTDYKEKHAEIEKQRAQEMIDGADNVEVDGDTITIKD